VDENKGKMEKKKRRLWMRLMKSNKKKGKLGARNHA
jgi:hypothetical protein